MHIARLGLRPLLVLAAALAAVLVINSFGSSTRHDASAQTGPFNPAGVVCINVEFGALPTAVEILARFDHQKNYPVDQGWELSQAAVDGVAPGGLVPDHNVGNCADTNAGGVGSVGGPHYNPANDTHPAVDVFKRPDAKGAIQTDVAGSTPCSDAGVTSPCIQWDFCSFQTPIWVHSRMVFPATGKDFGTNRIGKEIAWVNGNKCIYGSVASATYNTPAHAYQRTAIDKTTGAPNNSADWDGDGHSDYVELSPDKNTRLGGDPIVVEGSPTPGINLTGTYDIQVSLVNQKCATTTTSCNGNGGNDQYHCIARLDHEQVTEYVGVSTQCYDNTGALSASNGLPGVDLPGEGASSGGTTPQCAYPLGATTNDPVCVGPPPPPPYTAAPPANGNGQYCPGPAACGSQPADSLVITTCFPNVGGSAAPNIVAVLHDGDSFDKTTNPGDVNGPNPAGPAYDLAHFGKMIAAVQIFSNQSNGECDSKQPVAHGPTDPGFLPVNIYPAADATGNTPRIQNPCVAGGVVACVNAAWRAGHSLTNYTGNGCTDFVELAKPNPKGKCGDDPWNPLDVTGSCATGCDFTGPWSISATVTRADCQDNGVHNPCTLIPGLYYSCVADIQNPSGNNIDAHASCYINSPAFTNNKPGAGPGAPNATCPPADKKFCGDGLPGAPVPGCAQEQQVPAVTCLKLPAFPPSRHDCAGSGTSPDPNIPCDVSQWQLQHVDQSVHLVGTLDKVNNQLHLHGCAEDPHGDSAQGAVYISDATIGVHDGHGYVTIYTNETQAQCLAQATTGLKGTFKLDAVRQPPGCAGACAGVPFKPPAGQCGSPPVPCRDSDTSGPCTPTTCRDSDSDGCYDKDEMSGTATQGGHRDPLNPFDYPDMPTGSNAHKIRIDDVTYVINRYRHDMNTLPVPAPVYDPKADHTIIPGSNPGESWHLGPPNGQIRIDDVTAVINSYRHDCN